MTSLEYLNLAFSSFQTEAACDKVVNAIVANQVQNDRLKDINLFKAGEWHLISASAKEKIGSLGAKGLKIALEQQEWEEMENRNQKDEKK